MLWLILALGASCGFHAELPQQDFAAALAQVTEALKAEGFTMGVADNGPTLERTAVRYPSSMVDAAVDLASYLEFDPEFVTDEALTEIQLVTGSDFTALLTAPRSGVVVPATTTTTAPPVSVTPESTIGVVPGPTPAGTACE